MKKLFISLSFLLHLSVSTHAEIPTVDFMQAMHDGDVGTIPLMERDKYHPGYVQITEQHYNHKKPIDMPYINPPLIPKIMHHIWMEGDMPPLYENYLAECKALHPDWQFMAWSDKDIATLAPEYLSLYQSFDYKIGASDLMRYIILEKFGGVYRDTDVKCLRPIDGLNHKYTFFAGFEWPQPPEYSYVVNNGSLLGSAPHNPIIQAVLKQVVINKEQLFASISSANTRREEHMAYVKYCMWPLGDKFIELAKLDDKNIIFPATYFTPLGYLPPLKDREKHAVNAAQSGTTTAEIIEKIADLHTYDEDILFYKIKPESLVNHNFLKHEIQWAHFDVANGMKNDLNREKLLKDNSIEQRQLYEYVKDIYSQQRTAPYRKNSGIPSIIHLIDLDNSGYTNAELWHALNATFAIEYWDQARLLAEFPDLKEFASADNFRFISALKILQTYGGSVAKNVVLPIKPLFDLHNKFDFYLGLKAISSSTEDISISDALLGAQKQHPILGVLLNNAKIRATTALDSKVLTSIELGSNGIILPAAYIDPISPIHSDNLYRLVMKKITSRSGSLEKITQYAIVEP